MKTKTKTKTKNQGCHTAHNRRKYQNGAVKLTVLPGKYRPGFLSQLDRRYGLARLLHDEYEIVTNDLGGDLSDIKTTLVERFIFLRYVTRTLEHKILTAKHLDTKLLGHLRHNIQILSGLGKLLGLERKTHMVDSSVREYVKKKNHRTNRTRSL